MSADPPTGRPTQSDEQLTLSFPDAPRLELDQLLGQLVQRAQEVMGTQGRLRSLLRANQQIRGLDQPDILKHALTAGRELVGARYAAIGVAGPSGGLAEFLHDGMDPDTVARMGSLPQGKGLLGAMLDDAEPLRLARFADDSRTAGLPAGHPPMEGFLGVPIRLRGELFGAFYLTNPDHGEFTGEDEELLAALAASVGEAIDNAQLYEASRTRGEWLAASAEVTRHLLSAEPDGGRDPLPLIAARTREIADADLVLVLRPTEPQQTELTIAVSVGADAAHLRGRTIPVQGSLAGRVFTSAKPARVGQLSEGSGLRAITSGEVELGPILAVPLLAPGRVHGVLTAARLAGRSGFTDADVGMAASFANHAALALELAEARSQQQLNVLLGDRERIAADLHDHVIQRLFASGLTLHTLAATADAGPAGAGARLAGVIRDLDDTIRQIRSTIFQLHSTPATQGQSVRGRLLDLLADIRDALGFGPGLRFSGLLEDLPADLVDDLLAVLREALTNVAKHAGASRVEVDLQAGDGRLTLQVTDDGRGIDDTGRRSGLANLRRRAENRGGEFTLASTQPHGTRLSWSVPVG